MNNLNYKTFFFFSPERVRESSYYSVLILFFFQSLHQEARFTLMVSDQLLPVGVSVTV